MPTPSSALFRYGVIAELVRLAPGSRGLYARIAEKAACEYTIPGTTRRRIAAETIRHWLKRHRAGGFEALMPRPRADRGQPRMISDDVAELLVSLKESHPALPVCSLIEQARESARLRQCP